MNIQRRLGTVEANGRLYRIPATPTVVICVDGSERGYIEAAIELSGGRMSLAARRLGINRTTLYNRMESWQRR